MVKRLLKHEISYYLRTLIPVYIILLSFSVLGRVIQLFETDSVVYNIVFGSSVFIFVVALIVSTFMATVLAIVRFYRNLFTGEGYLTFTLPITSTQHIIVKLLGAFISHILTTFVMIASVGIITAGDVLTEIVKALGYVLGIVHGEIGTHLIFYIIEVVVVLLIASIHNTLLYFTFISIGQLFRKNRILAAFGAYFAFTVATQIIMTVLTSLFTAFYDYLPIREIVSIMEAHPYASAHIVICAFGLLCAIFSLVYFLITRYIINRKLNLE